MKAECKGCLLIAAGVFLGVGAYALVKSGAAKKATVKALAKGIELQRRPPARPRRRRKQFPTP